MNADKRNAVLGIGSFGAAVLGSALGGCGGNGSAIAQATGSDGKVQRLNPATLAPPVMNLYAQVAIAPRGRLAYVSGQVALDEQGRLLGAGDHAAQAHQCFINLQRVMLALGATPDDFVQMKLHVVDHTPALIAPIFGAGQQVFGAQWPLCASTYLGVQRLGLPEWLIEIDAVIAVA
jgi:enamine deaminase RidA (YjgF/YER057c/UK114 family)